MFPLTEQHKTSLPQIATSSGKSKRGPRALQAFFLDRPLMAALGSLSQDLVLLRQVACSE